ncbi:helix-turn-helix domain-containing protein [Natronococcus occultus]|uniref:Putative DNA binding protein n=1 Tax=Natronococcus occultus SP4 TaxID=694430 RepID=L0K0T9_9EURY|nr:helix-turn-helix domain-containing protein [Natronococcus occultus]AGB38621.1 putative DNA binding protein [Natronococcus occultus SP4]
MLIATFRLELDALALAETFERHPERVATHDTDWTMPCLWAANADFEALDGTLANDPTVDSIVETVRFDDEKDYHSDWSDDIQERIDAYVDHEGSLLSAAATADGWRVRFRFVARDQFDAFREVLTEERYSFRLLELVQPDEPRHSIGVLTPIQREALRAAREHGYYSVPREISTRELAAELDMSHQNLSEVLRRATENPVEATLQPTTSD